jgi:MoaA/NifB/PqqE/SkfB family radical SAM enzyme
MLRKTFFQNISPSGLFRAVRNRGVMGTVYHGMRRLGTMQEDALTGPSCIRINPMGYVCNHTCPMCWLQHLEPDHLKAMKTVDREEGLRLDEYRMLFDGVPSGLESVNIVGGGEPLVHREAVEIMAEVKKRRLKGSLISNGTLMKESISKRMIEMRWNNARISVHAGDAETYREIQGVDRFETMRENLKTFTRLRREAGAERKCELHIFHVIQRENIPTIDKLFSIAEEVGADYVEFDKIIPYDDGKWLSTEELKRAQESLLSCARDSKIPSNIGQIVPELQVEEVCAEQHKPFIPAKSCSVGFDQAFITAMGDVMPCCFSDENMGNIREHSFRDIWFGEKYTNFRKRLLHGKFAKYCITNRCTLPDVLHN